jgi:hypothetical protein
MSTVCEICHQGPAPEHGGKTVYRANMPGKMPARWRCREHVAGSGAMALALHGEVADVVNIIEGRKVRP